MARRKSQQIFEGSAFEIPKDCFGGSLLKNSNAKIKRPLDSKLPIHLVLRSVKGGMRLPKTFSGVNATVERTCKKHGVTVYKYANVGNHIHMVIKIPGRPRWSAFIRELTGRISQYVQGITGRQLGAEKFWSQRPFTRIVRGWKRAFKIAKDYVHLNLLEAEGFISRKETKTLRDLRAIWGDG
ncbi:MAG: transposase [Bdellovibrionales bacterium]